MNNYQINMNYVPDSVDEEFQGWQPINDETVYPGNISSIMGHYDQAYQEDEKPEDMFDIQLSMEDREKYVIIPGSKKIARVDLISESLGKSDDILAHSEKIVLPKGGEIMASKPGEKLHVSKIMELSGAADLLRRHYNIYRQSFY